MNSNIPLSPKYTAQVSLNPLTGMPKYTTTISYPEIKGKLNSYFYTTSGYSVSIEIEKQPDIARRVPVPVPVRQPVPIKAPSRNTGSDWAYAGGVLLIVGAIVVVVATVVEDIITVGAGTADDPASFALAATMIARGKMLIQGTRVAVTRLGQPGIPAGAAFAH